jgi:hypothetical protein
MLKVRVALLAALTLVTIVAVPQVAHASGLNLTFQGGPYFFRAITSDWQTSVMVADVENFSLADRARVHMWYWQDGNNQRWLVYTVPGYPSDQYVFKNQNSGKCLDKSMDGGNVDGAGVYQYTCSGAANQRWKYVPYTSTAGYAATHIVSVADSRCLDRKDQKLDNGTLVQVWGCNSIGSNQAWHV